MRQTGEEFNGREGVGARIRNPNYEAVWHAGLETRDTEFGPVCGMFIGNIAGTPYNSQRINSGGAKVRIREFVLSPLSGG